MVIYAKIALISIFSLFFGFQTWINQMLWFYPYRSFKHRNWWRH